MISKYSFRCIFSILTILMIGASAKKQMIGGQKAILGQFPYQIILVIPSRDGLCGGGIIDDYHILTAAHCVVKEDNHFNTDLFIVAGVNDRLSAEPLPIIREIKKIYVPNKFKHESETPEGDIAIIKLVHPLGLSQHSHRLKALKLPKDKHQSYTGQKAIITGFGWDWIKIHNGQETGGNHESQMKFAVAHVLGPEHLRDITLKLPHNIIWAKVEQHPDQKNGVCAGDSGGPLVYDGNIVIGILSSGPDDCSEADYGSVYTEVAKYLEFIDHAVHDKHHDNIRSHEY